MSRTILALLLMMAALISTPASARQTGQTAAGAAIVLTSNNLRPRGLTLDGLFYETATGRVFLPAALTGGVRTIGGGRWTGETRMPDRRSIRLTVSQQAGAFTIAFAATPRDGILKWGLALEALPDEYYTGLMERVVDGPQQASWAPGITTAMSLRGEKVEMLVKPTLSLYAPFYLSSRGYAVFVKGTWPGLFDFVQARPDRVLVEFEGPSFELKISTASNPAALVRAHAMEAGPPVLPPRWMYRPWRWRDEHTHRATYYDGTPVTGPFNSEVMEDVLMMQAFGIPNGVYWIDRPWGPGQIGYDDFEIDERRLPRFAEMTRWLDELEMKTLLWIAPFFKGRMETEAIEKGYGIPGQNGPRGGQNFPLADLTNPAAKVYWQDGVARLLRLGVAGFKLDRAEENIPQNGTLQVFDERTLREFRNAYPALFVQAAYEVARKHRGEDFIVMPRAGYTGSAAYGVFWGGDIGGTQEGLRASIIGVQRAAVMGYPNWGSDTCGYNQQLMEQEVCGRWLAFSAFTPIMEVGPTRNVAFWNTPREPVYDDTLIALWRMYAQIHDSLRDYSYKYAEEAHRTGMPIVRPLFLVDPSRRESWENWWSYLYGPDILVSPVWEKGKRMQQVYLPAGNRWRDAWNPDKTYAGGQTISVSAEPHQLTLFIRVGSSLKPWNLNELWLESLEIARKKPDLRALEASVNAWFEKSKGIAGQVGFNLR
jgi:alpha-glucosidase (family GH31 glycosyl hydrolase)